VWGLVTTLRETLNVGLGESWVGKEGRTLQGRDRKHFSGVPRKACHELCRDVLERDSEC
jgi:hypothetical protein